MTAGWGALNLDREGFPVPDFFPTSKDLVLVFLTFRVPGRA